MINGRLTFDEFSNELLRHIAFLSQADFDAAVTPSDASARVPGTFPTSWIAEAVNELAKQKYIKGVAFGDDVTLTIDGLREVESLIRLEGKDFWSELDEFTEIRRDMQLPDEPGIAEEVAGPTITIDHMSDVFRSIEKDIKDTIKHVSSQNELMAKDPLAAQKVAELEAGSALLKAPQADVGLLTRLILSALGYLLKKIADEGAKAIVRRLIDDLPRWIKSAAEAVN